MEFTLVSGPVAKNGNLLTITGAGSVVIEATVDADDIYHAASTVSRTFDITQATLTVTADNETMTYGESLPELSYEIAGFVYNEDVTALASVPEITTEATTMSPVGEYLITVANGVAANYVFVYEAGILEVNPAQLTISADDQSLIYGEAIPELTYTISGFVHSEDATVLDALPVMATAAEETSGAGTCEITGSGALSENYTFEYESGSLTIGKANLHHQCRRSISYLWRSHS